MSLSVSPGQWRNAGRTCKLGALNGSSLLPVLLPLFSFGLWYITLLFAVVYIGIELYLVYRGRRLSWVLRKFLFDRRQGVMFARTPRYWRLTRLYSLTV